jgi:hypothetical protein
VNQLTSVRLTPGTPGSGTSVTAAFMPWEHEDQVRLLSSRPSLFRGIQAGKEPDCYSGKRWFDSSPRSHARVARSGSSAGPTNRRMKVRILPQAPSNSRVSLQRGGARRCLRSKLIRMSIRLLPGWQLVRFQPGAPERKGCGAHLPIEELSRRTVLREFFKRFKQASFKWKDTALRTRRFGGSSPPACTKFCKGAVFQRPGWGTVYASTGVRLPSAPPVFTWSRARPDECPDFQSGDKGFNSLRLCQD